MTGSPADRSGAGKRGNDMRNADVAWEFCTANFRVRLEIEPEDMDPADSFDCEEDVEAVRSGAVEWFCASVRVYFQGREIARDSLGGCAYNSVREFYTSHRTSEPDGRNCSIQTPAGRAYSVGHYFPSMVAEATAEARKAFRREREKFASVELRA